MFALYDEDTFAIMSDHYHYLGHTKVSVERKYSVHIFNKLTNISLISLSVGPS
jgi:hypothetical protein